MVTCEKKEAELKREGKFSQGQEGLRAQNRVLCLGHFLLKSGGTVFGTFPIEIWFSVAIEKG